MRLEECQLERYGSQPPIEQILILDTVPIIVHTVLWPFALHFVHPPAPSVLTAPWMCCAHRCSPGCGANFRRVEVCPGSFTSLPEDRPTTLVTLLLLPQTFSIPLPRNYLKGFAWETQKIPYTEVSKFLNNTEGGTSNVLSSGHFTLLQGTPHLELLAPKFSRTPSPDKQSHIQSSCSCHQAGSPHLPCLQMIGLKLRYPVWTVLSLPAGTPRSLGWPWTHWMHLNAAEADLELWSFCSQLLNTGFGIRYSGLQVCTSMPCLITLGLEPRIFFMISNSSTNRAISLTLKCLHWSCNPCTMKLTLLKYNSTVYSECTVISSVSRMCSSPSRRSHWLSPPLPLTLATTILLFSFLWICLFQTTYINGIIQHLVLGAWLIFMNIISFGWFCFVETGSLYELSIIFFFFALGFFYVTLAVLKLNL